MKSGTFYRLTLVFALLATAAAPLFAGSVIDSLKALVEKEHEPLHKAELYLQLSDELKAIDLEQAEKYARQGMLLAEKSADDRIKGLFLAQLGNIASRQDSLDKAEKEYKRAIPLLEETEEWSTLAKVYINLGNRYIEKGNYPEAMNNYFQALQLAETTGDSSYLPRIYNNLGVVFIHMDDANKAVEYYSKALPLFEKMGDTINVAGAIANIGSIYMSMGEFDISRDYYQKSLKLFQQVGLLDGEAHVIFKLGLLDIEQGRYEEALEHLEESAQLQQQSKTISAGSKSMFLAETNIYMGIAYLGLKEYDKAEAKLLEGLEASQAAGQLSLISQACENLSKLYAERRDFEKAFKYQVLFKQYSDSLFNEENVSKLTQLEMRLEYENKVKEAELQSALVARQKKRMNIIYLGVLVVLILILVIVGLLLKLEKNKKKKLELEHEILEDKLEHTNKELTTHVMYLLKKNEFILSIIEKLKKAKLDAKPENKKIMSDLIAELQSNTDTVTWEEFEVRFQQVHTDFYTKLSQQFPDLTTNEIRLCAFFKLNMTTKEIAALTYQSLNSIKVARYRLRKKLKLDKDESLVSFLAKF